MLHRVLVDSITESGRKGAFWGVRGSENPRCGAIPRPIVNLGKELWATSLGIISQNYRPIKEFYRFRERWSSTLEKSWSAEREFLRFRSSEFRNGDFEGQKGPFWGPKRVDFGAKMGGFEGPKRAQKGPKRAKMPENGEKGQIRDFGPFLLGISASSHEKNLRLRHLLKRPHTLPKPRNPPFSALFGPQNPPFWASETAHFGPQNPSKLALF